VGRRWGQEEGIPGAPRSPSANATRVALGVKFETLNLTRSARLELKTMTHFISQRPSSVRAHMYLMRANHVLVNSHSQLLHPTTQLMILHNTLPTQPVTTHGIWSTTSTSPANTQTHVHVHGASPTIPPLKAPRHYTLFPFISYPYTPDFPLWPTPTLHAYYLTPYQLMPYAHSRTHIRLPPRIPSPTTRTRTASFIAVAL